MLGHEIGTPTRSELLRYLRALGKHRYVAGRLHQVHAFVFEAAGARAGLEAAHGWAISLLAADVDPASRDERLWRASSDDELVLAVEAMWTDTAVSQRLAARLAEVDAVTSEILFDELAEESTFPVLIDAGWELVPLSQLDPERHAGVIRALDAQDDGTDYEVACFEEQNRIPPEATLLELPLFGKRELLFAFADEAADAETLAPFVVWASGHPVYLDYVLRGVAKVAKVNLRETEGAAMLT